MKSEQESDTRFTKYIQIEHVDTIPNPQLVFVNEEGKDVETVFVSYIPLSMVKELMKDKQWVPKEAKKSELWLKVNVNTHLWFSYTLLRI